MNITDYINSVCAANRLRDTVTWMKESGEAVYYADRHVESPPEALGPRAACASGLALLLEWAKEAASLEPLGLIATKPMLVVDQEWLDELPDAPPPHVLMTLARTGGTLPPPPLSPSPVSRDNCPIGDLLTGGLKDATVFKIEACEERESSGAWLFQLDTSPTHELLNTP